MNEITQASRRTAARAAGFSYLFMVLGGIHYGVFVSSRLIVAGSATATASTALASEALFRVGVAYELLMAVNLVILAMAHFVLLRPVRRNLASLALCWVMVEAILAAGMALVTFVGLQLLRQRASLSSLGPERLLDLVGLYLNVRMAGHTVSAVFLSLGMLVFMILFLESRLVPRLLAGFGAASYALMLVAALVNILVPGSPVSMMSVQSTVDLICVMPSILFELMAGAWLLSRGVNAQGVAAGPAPGGGWSPSCWGWLVAVLVAGTVACGNSSEKAGNPAGRYVDEVLTLIERNHIHRSAIDWAAYQRQVRAAAAGAASLADLDPALQLAMDLLGDRHSGICRGQGPCMYQTVQGRGGWIGWSDPGALPAGVAYLRVERNSGSPLTTRQLADQLQAAVQAQDRDGLVGWIVDLRQNGGGNMWPMLAGIGPVLGDGTAGSFVFPEGVTTLNLAPGATLTWSYSGGAAWFAGQPKLSVTVPYTLRVPDPRVAVLQDGGTGSAGEAMAVSFIGRPNTRSFGAATFGVSNVNWSFPLSDGGELHLLVGLDRDRNGTTYGGPVAPDEPTAGPAEAVAAAVAWLINP